MPNYTVVFQGSMYNVALEKYHSEGLVYPRDYRKGWRGSIGNMCYTTKQKMLCFNAIVPSLYVTCRAIVQERKFYTKIVTSQLRARIQRL